MAKFKTAYLQREVPLNLDVVGNVKVGDCVRVTPATDTVAAYMQKSSFANATHIVAQSDMTLGFGTPLVEIENYKYGQVVYSPEVKQTVAVAPTEGTSTGPKENGLATTTTWKHVALYQILDKNDIVLDADGNDVV